jgi:hypothetical protein
MGISATTATASGTSSKAVDGEGERVYLRISNTTTDEGVHLNIDSDAEKTKGIYIGPGGEPFELVVTGDNDNWKTGEINVIRAGSVSVVLSILEVTR